MARCQHALPGTGVEAAACVIAVCIIKLDSAGAKEGPMGVFTRRKIHKTIITMIPHQRRWIFLTVSSFCAW
jgi:hypothetical protein